MKQRWSIGTIVGYRLGAAVLEQTMTPLIRLSILGAVLCALTLGNSPTLDAKGKSGPTGVAKDQQVVLTATPGTDTAVVIKPGTDFVELNPTGKVVVSDGKQDLRIKQPAALCVKAGGCDCPQGQSYTGPGPAPVTMQPGKFTIRLTGRKRGAKAQLSGRSIAEECQKRDRCLAGTWNADLSAYLASAHMTVTSISGSETYRFLTRVGIAYADAKGYTINVIGNDGNPGTIVINGSATASWLTPQPGALQLSSSSGGWTLVVDSGPAHYTFPATGTFALLGPWGGSSGGTYQCSPSGTSAEYSPSPQFAPIVLTKVSG